MDQRYLWNQARQEGVKLGGFNHVIQIYTIVDCMSGQFVARSETDRGDVGFPAQ
jgi:hypothetical protein